jgi:hypothetical protein
MPLAGVSSGPRMQPEGLAAYWLMKAVTECPPLSSKAACGVHRANSMPTMDADLRDNGVFCGLEALAQHP